MPADLGRRICWSVDDRSPGPVPVREIPGLVDARQVSLGSYFGCTAPRDGGVSCWATGSVSELGQPVAPFVKHLATHVPGLSRITQVVTSGHTACARSAEGVMSYWGRLVACELSVKLRKVGALSKHPLVVEDLEPS